MKFLSNRIRSFTIFSASGLAVQFSGLIASFLVFRWVDPYYVGIWQALVLIETYSVFLRLGILNGLARELSFLIGKGDHETATAAVSTTLTVTLANMGVFIILAAVIPFFLSNFTEDHLFPYLCMVLLTLFSFYYSFLLCTFRAKTDFDKLSRIQFLYASLKLLSLVMIWFWGFKGYFAREMIVMIIVTVVIHLYRPIRVLPGFDKKVLKQLFYTGFPIFLASSLIAFFNTSPRLYIIKFGTLEMLGTYAPLLTLIALFASLSDSFSTYFYPRMSTKLGQTGDKTALWRDSKRIHLIIIGVYIPIAIAGYFILPWIMNNFLTRYKESATILQTGVIILVFAGFRFGFTTLSSLKAWKHIVIYVVVMGILFMGVPWILLQRMEVIGAVLWSQIIASFLMVVTSLTTNYFATHEKKGSLLRS